MRRVVEWLCIRKISLVSLFNGISTFRSYLMPKPSLKKNCRGNINRQLGMGWFQSAESSWRDILRPAVMSAARIWLGVSCLWTYLEAQGALPTVFIPPRRGQVYRLASEALLFRWMQTGPEAFWGMLRVWATVLCPDPPCATLIHMVRQPTNTVREG